MVKAQHIRVAKEFKDELDNLRNKIKSKTGKPITNPELTRTITPLLNVHLRNTEIEKKRMKINKYKIEVSMR